MNLDELIVNYKNRGYGSRQIGLLLGIGKSTVNERYNKYLEGNPSKKGMRILFFDLETAPSVAAVFGRWNTNISHDSVIREGGDILTAAWKYSDSPHVHIVKQTPKEAREGNDLRIVAQLLEAIEDADAVCAHNLDKFDWPVFKTRLVVNKMPPPKQVKRIDTLKIAKQLKFNSNKLDALSDVLLNDRKQSTDGIKLWIRCIQGDKEAINHMATYNAKDVELLEELYHALKAFDDRHPNAGQFYNDGQYHCPVCGSTDVEETGNAVITQVSQYPEMLCKCCGHRSRTRKAVNTKEHRSLILL